MPSAQRFEDLLVWQRSHQLALRVYRLTNDFPKREIFGLAAQMRRAAVSVPANIAEGFKRHTRSDKARLMNVAQASLEELRYYFILTADLGYTTITTERVDSDELARMLHAYIAALRSNQL